MAIFFKEKSWWQFTLTRITIALALGMLIGKYLALPNWLLGFCFVSSFTIWLFIDQLSNLQKFKNAWILGTAIQLLFLVVGMMVYRFSIPSILQINARVTIQETPIKKPNSFQTTAAMNKSILLIYFHPSIKIDSLKAGTNIQLHKKPLLIANASNPGGFNFKEYAASQHIYHQVYLTRADFTILNKSALPISSSLLNKAKVYVLTTLKKFISNFRERSVAEALLIGYKKNLDKELMNAYSNTGVIHIIAISGLHLGMIYSLLLWLLKPMNQIKKLQWLKRIIILLILWGFTLLTGAGASVLRAAVMFSFLILAEQQNRPNQIINTLAASAFCLLLYNPIFLWDIGFQLSYAAVLGIIIFSRPIEKILYVKNKILRNCWQLCSVTLAAQLLTLPMLLYYFNSFPNLFILTNFFAVPISGLILYLLIGLLLTAPFVLIAKPIGNITEWLLLKLNDFIQNTASLPFALTEYIQVSLLQTLCLYSSIFAASIWIAHKNKTACWTALFAFLLFIVLRSVNIVYHQIQQKILVYHCPKYTAIDLMEGLGHRYIGDLAVEQNILLKNNYLSPTRTLYRAGQNLLITHTKLHSPFIISPNQTILLVHPQLRFPKLNSVPKIDLIVVAGGSNLSIPLIAQFFPNSLLVFDSSNPLWKIQLWKKEAERLHLRHHSVPEKGAFEYNL